MVEKILHWCSKIDQFSEALLWANEKDSRLDWTETDVSDEKSFGVS